MSSIKILNITENDDDTVTLEIDFDDELYEQIKKSLGFNTKHIPDEIISEYITECIKKYAEREEKNE